MPFCSNCGKPLDPSSNFCNNCGVAVGENNAPVTPTTPTIIEPAAQVYNVPINSTKSKVLGFVGMGLSIAGLTFAILGLLYTFIGVSAEEALGFGFSVAFGLFSMPLSIVGGILCGRSSSMGNYSAACSVGSKLRVAGIIVSAIMLFVGFFSLFA